MYAALGTSTTSEQCEQCVQPPGAAGGSKLVALWGTWAESGRGSPGSHHPLAHPLSQILAGPSLGDCKGGRTPGAQCLCALLLAPRSAVGYLRDAAAAAPVHHTPCRCGGQPAVNPCPGTDCQTQQPSPSARIYLESARWSDAGSRTVGSGFWLVLVALDLA